MKILILNTAEHTGGAAVAANRLLRALLRQGVSALMLVRDRATDDPAVVSLDRGAVRRWLNFLCFVWDCLGTAGDLSLQSVEQTQLVSGLDR